MKTRALVGGIAVVGLFAVLVAVSVPKFASTREKAQAAAARAAAREMAEPAAAGRVPASAPTGGTELLRFPTAAELQAQVPADTARLLIRTGTMDIQVDSLEPAVEEVGRIAAAVGGYLSGTSTRTTRSLRSATLSLRVPAATFDPVVTRLRALGDVEAVNVEVEDVGEEYTDVAARMANSQRLEARLLDMLARRTGSLQDVLQVERELSRVREQIERFAGRLQYLRSHAAVSTLTVRLHEPGTVVGSQPGFREIGEAFKQAWRNFVYFIAFLVQAMGVLVPLGALAWVSWRVWRRLRPAG